MKRVAVIFATSEGHTCRIAEHVADGLRVHGIETHVRDVCETSRKLDLDAFDAVVLAAPVHIGRHGKKMEAFIRAHRAELERIPSAFVSVSLSQAGAQTPDAPAEKRAQAAADVQGMLDELVRRTGWRPARVKPVAGALMYRRYNFLVRFVMKRIARRAGGPTDTSRNHDLTDWHDLDRFVDTLAHEILAQAAPEVLAPPR
jgi:menaquinone-dependent protoporphyrinogen oxidase